MASFAPRDLFIQGSFTVTLWTAGQSGFRPDWVFPLTTRGPVRVLPTAYKDPQIPSFTQKRITVGDCVGVAALLDGFPGLPFSVPSQRCARVNTFHVVWVEVRRLFSC